MDVIYIGLALFVSLVVTLVIRTLLFRPKTRIKGEVENIKLDNEKIANHLSKMIQCRTISNKSIDLVYLSEMNRFKQLLVESYPNVHRVLKKEEIEPNGLLYHWSGKCSDEPIVLMSHFDVVPVEQEFWEVDAFSGLIDNEFIWGRGTLDTKGTLCAILEAVEYLIEKGYVPKQDLYLSFGGDEEVSGESTPNIVSLLKSRGIKPALVLDEGGAIVSDVFPGVKNECALVGIAEKGYMDVELEFIGHGGHASSPIPHTPVGRLARAITRIENHPMRPQFTKPTLELFQTLGRHSSILFRMIFANLFLFKPLLSFYGKKTGGQLNALMRTTCAFTKMEGSSAFNVIPPISKVGANLRIMGTTTKEDVINHLQKVINDSDIFVKVCEYTPATTISRTDSVGYQRIVHAIESTYPEVLISPYLVIAATDSRHYHAISDAVYRFSPMHLSTEELGLIHGNNERIPISTLVRTVEFYIRLLDTVE